MLEYYFQKALIEDISMSEFMNVIRIILQKSPTHEGADGDKHYASVAKREREKVRIANLEVVEDDSVNEEKEVEEIVKSYSSQDNIKEFYL